MTDANKAPIPLPGVMPNRLPENAPAPDFDPKAVAKALLRATRAGALATIDRNTGHPFASLVNVATDVDGSPLILVSRLSTHTANLEIDGRASLLLASTGKGDPLAHPRLTLLGIFVQIARDDPELPRIPRRFLARAADLKAADVMTDIADAENLIDAEESAVTHMNDDHAEAVRLYATKLIGAEDGPWRLSGLDPDGLDLAHG